MAVRALGLSRTMFHPEVAGWSGAQARGRRLERCPSRPQAAPSSNSSREHVIRQLDWL